MPEYPQNPDDVADDMDIFNVDRHGDAVNWDVLSDLDSRIGMGSKHTEIWNRTRVTNIMDQHNNVDGQYLLVATKYYSVRDSVIYALGELGFRDNPLPEYPAFIMHKIIIEHLANGRIKVNETLEHIGAEGLHDREMALPYNMPVVLGRKKAKFRQGELDKVERAVNLMLDKADQMADSIFS